MLRIAWAEYVNNDSIFEKTGKKRRHSFNKKETFKLSESCHEEGRTLGKLTQNTLKARGIEKCTE